MASDPGVASYTKSTPQGTFNGQNLLMTSQHSWLTTADLKMVSCRHWVSRLQTVLVGLRKYVTSFLVGRSQLAVQWEKGSGTICD